VFPVRILTTFGNVFWVVIMGVVALYAFFLVMGAVTPADQALLTAGVLVLAAALVVHLIRVRRAMHEHGHEDELRELHKMRETRGF
jgi:steroid 5-alpha reductase family enzyme